MDFLLNKFHLSVWKSSHKLLTILSQYLYFTNTNPYVSRFSYKNRNMFFLWVMVEELCKEHKRTFFLYAIIQVGSILRELLSCDCATQSPWGCA